MKIFDFLVKRALLGAFLFQLRDSRHVLLPENQRSIEAVSRDTNLSIEREMLQKWLFWLKNQKSL